MVLAIIQARMSSTRLPGKVLMPIHGKPMLQWVIEAAQGATKVDKVVVATSLDESDLPLVNLSFSKVDIFQGSLTDVLDRYYQAAVGADLSPSDLIVRLTSDCPLLYSKLIDAVITFHKVWKNDYTWNRELWPSGFDVEVFSFAALQKAKAAATSEYDKEHVTTYIRDHPQDFKCGIFAGKLTKKFEGKWSVDTKEDLDHVSKYFLYFKQGGRRIHG